MAAVLRPPFADARRPRPAELRRWQKGYARVALRQRELIQAGGVDRQRAVEISREMIDATLGPGSKTVLGDAVRRRGEASVRRIWRRLRASVLP